MPNRQHGRSRSPAGSRSSAASRSAYTVPVSRSPAVGRFSGEGRVVPQTRPGTPGYIEPEVRRWPHPVEDETLSSTPGPEPALHYIRCALSYQNQLLADIKVLLEQMAIDRAAAAEVSPTGDSTAVDQEKG